MKFSSRYVSITLVSGVLAQDSAVSLVTYSVDTYQPLTTTPPFNIHTVAGPPNPTAVSAESSYVASQASVISFGGGGSYAPQGLPVVTSTLVTDGMTYTVVVPTNGATTVVPVTIDGRTVYQTIIIPTAGPGPVATTSPVITTAPGPVASGTFSNPGPSGGSSPPASSAPVSPATTSPKPAPTTYHQSSAVITRTTTPSQGVTTLTTMMTTTPSAASDTSTTSKVPSLTGAVQTTLATIKPSATSTITVGPVPPAHGAGSIFGLSQILLWVAVGLSAVIACY